MDNIKNAEMTQLYERSPSYQSYYTTCLEPTLGSFYTVEPEAGKCCAQFIVSRDRILHRTKQFYQDIYDWLLAHTDGEGNGNPEHDASGYNMGRYMEYTWRFIFNGKPA
jgi:hypothetical protein